MTREEAIEWIEGMILYIRDGVNRHMYENAMYLSEGKLEALDMAIEALSANRPTHERDLISRHEALMELNGACEMWEDDAIVAEIIHKLPSIDIVRCKDCRHFKKIVERSNSGLCHRDLVASVWKENDYCSRGKRKGGDTE